MTDPLTSLRVGVVGGRDRVDLVVPAGLSVAELVAEVAPRLGAAPPTSGTAPRLAPVGGPALDPGRGLVDQGVADGALLTLTAPEARTPTVRDDLAGAVAEVVEALPRHDAHRPAAGLALATTVLVAGAAAVVVERTAQAAVVGCAVAGLLLGLAAVATRRRRDGPAAVAGWCAVLHAAAAGSVLGWSGAAAALFVAGGVVALLARRTRTPARTLWAAPVAGGVLLATALGALAAPVPLPVVATLVLAGVVLAGDLVPWAAAWCAGLVAPTLDAPVDVLADRAADAVPPPDELAGVVRRAHDLLLVWAVAVVVLLAVLGPVVASHGRWGPAVAVLCCAVVALRGRRHRAGRAGSVALAGALAALLPVALATWTAWPDARLLVTTVGLGLGLSALAAVVLPPPSAPRTGRLAELLEALVLVALPPAVLAASGLLDVVRELVA